MVSRVFYEAARDLDSPPSPRADHVEACRPRECFVPSDSSREVLTGEGKGRPDKSDADQAA